MLALGVMITSKSRSFFGDLTRIFTGDLFGVDATELMWQALAVVFVMGVAWVCRRPFMLLSLEPELATTSGFHVRRYENLLLLIVAVAIVSSFQVVGTLLVFGMLLAPAATAALVTRRVGAMMGVAALVGSVSVYAGLLLSYHADLAGGASVVAVAVGIFLVTFAVTEVRRSVGARRGTRSLAHTHGGEHGHHH